MSEKKTAIVRVESQSEQYAVIGVRRNEVFPEHFVIAYRDEKSLRELIAAPSIIGIGFSLIVVAVAALNLVLDFDFIEQGVQVGAPRYMEWYGAFGIIVTLVWLYLEILILLSKLRNRN